MKQRALISVSDKSGIIELSQALVAHGIEIVSTGGTASLLEKSGIPVINISDVTGFPEIMDGRVKTLHPNIHGGLLAIRANEEHMHAIESLGIQTIDYVIVNLYPFHAAISDPNVTLEHAIENIDIGGPSMLRAAAKNYQDVVVVVDSSDYKLVMESLESGNELTREDKFRLAAKVFRHTAAYDSLVASYLTRQTGEPFPEKLTYTWELAQGLRYGENPHQAAAFYQAPFPAKDSISGATQLHGKELSFNNIHDAHAALSIVQEFSEPTAVAVKHTNPCGVGIGVDIESAFERAYSADPVSIFGGIVALNRPVTAKLAMALAEIFLEIVLAPEFTPEAFEILSKKKNLRLLTVEAQAGSMSQDPTGYSDLALLGVGGGLLLQDRDRKPVDVASLQVVTERAPSEEEMQQLLFAWRIVKHVKSNAIVVATDNQTLGVGAGQMNRVGSATIALEQAGPRAQGAVLSSDAFFPMGDTVELAAKHGITAIIQPGGSVRDEESIAACNQAGIAMLFTGTRHFKH